MMDEDRQRVKTWRTLPIMASREIESGPVAEYVRENLQQIRKRRGLTRPELSAQLAGVGRPLLPTGIAKIEDGTRRVDVDDLVALAIALGVNPTRLLLPDDVGEQPVALTSAVAAPSWAAWQWCDGFAPLPTGDKQDGYNTADEVEDFELYARPTTLRRERRHPLVAAVATLDWNARRALAHARNGAMANLKNSLTLARRSLRRASDELDALEEEVAERV